MNNLNQIQERVNELLDSDKEGFETLEILIESDTFMTQLKELLGLVAYSNNMPFKLGYARKEAIAKAANGLILEAEDYLAKLVEEDNV